MDRYANTLRFIFVLCLTVLAVNTARAAPPDGSVAEAEGVTRPALGPRVVNELAMELKTRMGD